jgi:hypothetical protein
LVAVRFTPENLERIANQHTPDIRPASEREQGSHVLFHGHNG